MGDDQSNSELEEFKPKGAIAFFIVLMVFFTIVWFTLYFELLSRG
ncbi:MAG: cytochrome c oxidase subunit 2A [Balneolaceae bacterium]|nr:MAG: cytochrome c oxidase subunit 2A [Balneolaceae bacterium]